MANTAESLISRVGRDAAALLAAGDALKAVQHEPHEVRAPAVDMLYRAVWLYASAAQTGNTTTWSRERGRALLRYCTMANYFVSSMPGYWGNNITPIRNTLFAAGMTVSEEDAVIDVLRGLYRQPGVLLPPESVAPGSVRNISHETRGYILDHDARTFHYGAHELPVNPAAWDRVSKPFHEAVLAVD